MRLATFEIYNQDREFEQLKIEAIGEAVYLTADDNSKILKTVWQQTQNALKRKAMMKKVKHYLQDTSNKQQRKSVNKMTR